MRLVNAQGTSAARSLTSSADAVSNTHPLGRGIPKGDEGDSSKSMLYSSSLYPPLNGTIISGIGLGIIESEGDDQVSTPSAHLENARKNLRFTLLASHHNRLDSPVLTQPDGDTDIQNDRLSTPSAKDSKRCCSGFPKSVQERSRPCELKDLEEIRAAMGGEVLPRCVKHVSHSLGGSFWSISTAGGRMWTMKKVSAQDSHSHQALLNELNALRRVRYVNGLPWLEEVDEKKDDTLILMVSPIDSVI